MKKVKNKRVILIFISIFIVLFLTVFFYLSTRPIYTPRKSGEWEMLEAVDHIESKLSFYIAESEDIDLKLNSSSTVKVRELLNGLYYGIEHEGIKYPPYIEVENDKYVKMLEDKKLKIVIEKIGEELDIQVNVADKDEIIIIKK